MKGNKIEIILNNFFYYTFSYFDCGINKRKKIISLFFKLEKRI